MTFAKDPSNLAKSIELSFGPVCLLYLNSVSQDHHFFFFFKMNFFSTVSEVHPADFYAVLFLFPGPILGEENTIG